MRWQSGILRGSAETGRLDDLEDEVDDLRDQVAPVTVDATGNLGNPPNDGVEAALGSSPAGCVRPTVSRFVFLPSGFSTIRLNAAYGTTRTDTVGGM